MTSPAAQARVAAARILQAVRAGRTLDAALAEAFAALPPALHRERALIQEMSYGGVRWLRPLLGELETLLNKPLRKQDDDLEALLVIGLYQLRHMRIGAHAAVNETVAAAAALGKDWSRNFVNAVLRRAQREPAPAADRSATHPDWLLARLQAAYPDDWETIVAANDARAPLTLRVNLSRTTRTAYLEKLQQAGLGAQAVAEIETALMLETPVPVEQLPGFADGAVSVQDAAAQLAAVLLDVHPGMRVLDACAAPGGKAAHILERTPSARLVVLDIDGARLARVRENFVRLGLAGEIVAGDADRPADWWDGRPFDRILLDAPCSATGVIRRHPDIRLHRRPDDIDRLTRLQARLLDRLWPLLAPGGKLLYVTCSILPEENGRQAEAFAARQPLARSVPLAHPALARHARLDGDGYQILPGAGDMDGFYFAGFSRARHEA